MYIRCTWYSSVLLMSMSTRHTYDKREYERKIEEEKKTYPNPFAAHNKCSFI